MSGIGLLTKGVQRVFSFRIKAERSGAGRRAPQPGIPELDARLTSMERVFRAPPLTPELVAAIKLISPHCDFRAEDFTAEDDSAVEDQYRSIWEADQNGACWGEYEALAPLLGAMPVPAKVLEIGPGMGRSLVFFSKKLGWQDSQIHGYEGDGTTTKYTVLGPRFQDSFCGNIGVLRSILDHNGIHNVRVFNAREQRLADLPGPYDLIYSFYSIGFHWSLAHFLDDLLPLLHERSIAIFTVPREFRPFPGLSGLAHRVIDWKTAWPKDCTLKLLVLSKSPLPGGE
jgi:hypothetical protein